MSKVTGRNIMIIAIASGKGGTGKTTVSANLARIAGASSILFDCDVEEPNAGLFLRGECVGDPEDVTQPIPEIDESLCDGCKACSNFCEYKALAVLGTKVLVFPELCHGCGGCIRVCPQGAMTEVRRKVGVIETLKSGDVTLIQGRLNVGGAMASPVIHAVKSKIDPSRDAILDAPPGTACPVVATMRGSDYVVLVTEPTPFGLNDLKLAIDLARELKLPFGVVVNRAGSGDQRVQDYCAKESITLLAEIPDDRRIAEAYSRGELAVDVLPEYKTVFTSLLATIKSQPTGTAS